MVSIYDYLNYRTYLKDAIASKKRSGRAISLESLSRKSGRFSKALLSLVLNEKRDLTPANSIALGEAIGLKGKNIEYFENLVRFNQSKTHREKEIYLDRLVRLKPSFNELSTREITEYRLLESWHSLAIRELSKFPNFRDDPAWISKRLHNRVSASEAKRALQTLKSLELLSNRITQRNLRSTDKSKTNVRNPQLRSHDEVQSIAIRKYHKSCMELGKKVLEDVPVEEREFASINLTLTPEQFGVVKRRMKEFRDEIAEMSSVAHEDSKLCQINFQFFQINGGHEE